MQTTKTSKPQPRTTVEEIDEALWWTCHQPKRDKTWQRWINALLDARLDITKETP